jgi:valyl-tRNA synthetase
VFEPTEFLASGGREAPGTVAAPRPVPAPTSAAPQRHREADASRPPAERSELDRWILSELNRTVAAVVERMDAYDNYEACKRLHAFVDGLSNW